mmetsp:Transcript_28024/g.42401  ORF Transcript_28024/g.42401 Transcript_28024/m.42401 type:complete len:326 (+) Transcript_28024:124-1101(+)
MASSDEIADECERLESSTTPLPEDFPKMPIGHPDSMMSAESVRRAVEEFTVRPTDIIVATFPKTGTTLVTWICHQLRTGGDVNFENIYEVIPWPTLSWDIGYNPNEQGSNFVPRVFKSHLRMSSIYRGCKYIVTVRDPVKTTQSFYNFLANAKQVPQVQGIGASAFARETPFVKGRPGRASIWDYYKEYHLLLECDSVLILVYEDMVKNMSENIRMIAAFMGIKFDKDLISKVMDMSTKDFMMKYQEKFDEPYERAKQLGRVADLSQLNPGAKVAVDSHLSSMDDEGMEFLEKQWKHNMEALGYSTYEAFASVIREANRKRFSLS